MLTLTRGRLRIAEVTSRIGDISAFISAIDAFGFRLDSKVLPAYLYEGWPLIPLCRMTETLTSSCSNLPKQKIIR